MKARIATAVQIAGAATLSTGVGLVNVAAGVICAGVCALVFGVALERG